MTAPQHVAIILDGNRRWAAKNGFPKIEGHRHGIEALKRLLPAVIARNIPVVSLFTFSRENWRRAANEVSFLMKLVPQFFRDHFDWMREQRIQVRFSGRLSDFSQEVQDIFQNAAEATKDNTRLVANFCVSYGGREEMAHAARLAATEAAGNPVAIAAIDENALNKYLYTSGLPDVDLMIRTGGEKRISGFLPWQSVYAELYFTDKCWPEFDEAELDKALEDFSKRKRNFGA